ncbi:cobalamin biosynthesis protein [Thiocystis violacea]|uniref:cobalamin biosynthesis protein n=1 Tax=Thiocystis violacea TaxID=13725 RepID=UPI00190567BF|nr:cobalamin biosynthesis protein [Thiocystis violacea]MBK1722753.1 cobalamin biosynthesis protein CbiG [Thiocystis violacea]
MTEPIPVAIGIGCQRGTALATLEAALDAILAELGAVEVRCIASHLRKADEPALLALAEAKGWPLQCYGAEQLAAVSVPNPSARVAAEVSTPSVAEAAALLAAGNHELLLEKRRYLGTDGKGMTLAVARCRQDAIRVASQGEESDSPGSQSQGRT